MLWRVRRYRCLIFRHTHKMMIMIESIIFYGMNVAFVVFVIAYRCWPSARSSNGRGLSDS